MEIGRARRRKDKSEVSKRLLGEPRLARRDGGAHGQPLQLGARVRPGQRCGIWAPGIWAPRVLAEAMSDRGSAARPGEGHPHISETAQARVARPCGGQDWERRGACGARAGARAGAHLGLLLGKAGLRRNEAQRSGVRVLVDLVEVVLQDLHLVLCGAARGLCGHGPGGAAGEGEARR